MLDDRRHVVQVLYSTLVNSVQITLKVNNIPARAESCNFRRYILFHKHCILH